MKKLSLLFSFVSIAFFAIAQVPQKLLLDTTVCASTVSRTVDARVLKTRLCNDSIQIIFNSAGTTLNNDTNVYIHSGPEFYALTGWQLPFTVGHYNSNDGVGKMKKIGANLWSITILPRTYYGYGVDTPLNGIFMVFRNFNGSITAKDGSKDIFLLTANNSTTGSIANVTANYIHNTTPVTYTWSDAATDSVRVFTTGGTYTVTASSVGGCTATGLVKIRLGTHPLTLGPDVIRCTTAPSTITATTGFVSYQWTSGATVSSNIHIAKNPGTYWVKAIDSNGCTAYDTVKIFNTAVTGLSIVDTVHSCPGVPITLDASTHIDSLGDSLVIVYDATQGQTGLVNLTKVYFHSGPEFFPFQGWQTQFTVGSFTNDDGIGLMTSLGNNKWRIAIDPQSYYGYTPDSNLNGVFMVFRNFNGTATGKDNSGKDIFVNAAGITPFSAFTGVTPSHKARGGLSYSWSNGANTPTASIASPGVYAVTVSDGTCSQVDSVHAIFSAITPISIGTDTQVCLGKPVNISAPTGYKHYSWSSSDTTISITKTVPATYTVTATDTSGCQSVGSRKITNSSQSVSLGVDIIRCSTSPTSLTATAGFASYSWINKTAVIANTYSATNAGCYWVKATDTAGCITYDTVQVINSPVINLSLVDTFTDCPGHSDTIDAATTVEQHGDSLIIIYDATKGVSTLTGAKKVYMHSGPEFHPFTGWQTAYTVGHYGIDDGIGKMDSLGNNKWRIAIVPQCYYNYSPDTPLNGIFMVFRNEDGTKSGKDGSNANIFINLSVYPATCSFNGVTPIRKSNSAINYSWQTPAGSVSGSSVIMNTTGLYIATAVSGLCTKSDTIHANFNSNPIINIGNDTTVCKGDSVIMDAGVGYTHYAWSNNDTTRTTRAKLAGTYHVTVTNGTGCNAIGTRKLINSTKQLTLGADIVRCANAATSIIANSGFVSYSWVGKTPALTSTYSAVNAGCYWAKAIDSFGCASYDTVMVINSPTSNLSVPDSIKSCIGSTVSVDASLHIEQHGDSVVILYDATKGNTTLPGAKKVYMHSGPEFRPLTGWQLPYTVGHYGQDDGIGKMDSLGNNLWRIAIIPQCYYGYSPDSPLNGLFMVFRNEDGSKKGNDIGNQDIFVNLSVYPPTCSFNGVTTTRKSYSPVTYSWQTPAGAVSGSNVSVTTSGLYILTAQSGLCVKNDTIHAAFTSTPTISIGNDTTVCTGDSIKMDAGAGYTHYSWSNGDTTQTTIVHAANTYHVTVTTGTGCLPVGTRAVHISTKQVNLGADIIKCNNTPAKIIANTGFASYSWIGRPATSADSILTTRTGCYWVKAIDSFGCASYDSLQVHYSPTLNSKLQDTFKSCPGNIVSVDPTTSIYAKGDSIVIIYDATKGVSGLVGASKVYMHSGPEFTPFTGWQGQYTVGHFNLDDGIGKMDSLGNNKWRISFMPQCYYGYSPDSNLNGIFMVFRNANGTQTGKDGSNQNIFLNLSGTTPTSSFAGINAFRTVNGLSYNWSNGQTGATQAFSIANKYFVTITDGNGCSNVDSTVISFNNSGITVNLGNDTTVCVGQSVKFDAGAGYVSYHWNTGDSTRSITTATVSTYTVSVTGGNGCTATDTVKLLNSGKQINLGSDVYRCDTLPVTLTAPSGFKTYQWMGVGASSTTHSAVRDACYWIKATDSTGCVSYDTLSVQTSVLSSLSNIFPDSIALCNGNTDTLNPSVTIIPSKDSITIIYDATQGTTQLVGATKVYMHSGPEFHPFAGWNTAYTVGNFNKDDGIGQMTSIGNNKWEITICPYCYYHISPDTPLNGIFMVFRNEDGTKTGKDGTNKDIYIGLYQTPIVSAFSGVTASYTSKGNLTYNWSNSTTASTLAVATPGVYAITVTDGSCVRKDTVNVVAKAGLTINLGPDTCQKAGGIIKLVAPSGYTHYQWNTGVSSSFILVNNPGTYVVTVTDTFKCTGFDSIVVKPTPTFSLGKDTCVKGASPITIGTASGLGTYLWNTGATTNIITVTTAPALYSITVTSINGCSGADTIKVDTCAGSGTGSKPKAKIIKIIIGPSNSITLYSSNTSTTTTGTTYTWYYGDGTSSNDTGSSTHTYANTGAYKVTLIICNAFGCDTVYQTINVNTGIHEIDGLSAIAVYPIPATDLCHIAMDIADTKDLHVEISNMLGVSLQTEEWIALHGNINRTIDLSNLTSGIYIVKLSSGGQYLTQKIQVIK